MAAMLLAGTVAATPARAADAPGEHIVNGDFEYPGGVDKAGDYWIGVERHGGQYYDLGVWQPFTNGFDPARFGWDSTETDGTGTTNQRRANEVELQYDPRAGNTYAELCADQAGTAIYQDIATTPGALYTVSLKHTSLVQSHADSMRVVMIGQDGTRTIVPMTRTESNMAGDPVGETSETITTHATNSPAYTADSEGGWRNHGGQWASYRGTYKATGTVTRFTFESVSAAQPNLGNLIDDVSFQTAYPLAYDANGGVGTLPKQTD